MTENLSLQKLNEQIRVCQKCPLHKSRIRAVPGEGPSNPKIMLIGEAPGKNEDLQGKPFVGSAGKKLSELLQHAGIKREDVFITSVVKCRPPENRLPINHETKTCTKLYLFNQIKILKPKIIGLMGKTAVQHVLDEKIDLAKMHGKTIQKNNQKYVILYHPAAMIYNQQLKETMMKDFETLKYAREEK